MAKKAMEITELNFEEVLKESDMPVLIDFWAEGCGPCIMLAPTVDELAEQYLGKAIVGKVEVHSQEALAQRYEVMSLPTLILFKNGKVAGRSVGVIKKEEIANMINSEL